MGSRAMDEQEIRGRTLRWLSHGEYRLKGVDDDLSIFEVGVEGAAPLDGGRLGVVATPLSWLPGLGADSHDVFLGTDWRAVRDASTASPEYAGNFVGDRWPSGCFLAPVAVVPFLVD